MTDLTKYQKLSEREHVLKRAGMYIGAIQTKTDNCYVPVDDKMVEQTLSYSPALLKMFDEIISNSVDEHIRSGKVTRIDVDLYPLTGEIKITDNGGIPVKKHPEHDQYIPSMIFGELRTGSNFSDDERFSAGLNGLGSKLTSIYSKEFTVTTADGKNKLVQRFEDNLAVKNEPSVIKSNTHGTTIQFTPDYERLDCELDEDNIKRIEKRVYDVAGCNPKIKVFLNGKLLRINKFKDYVGMYTEEVIEDSNEHWHVAVAASSNDEFKHVSFVNSVDVFNGGSHVDYITNQITAKLRKYIKKKHKIDVKPNNIKQQLMLFINCKINAPMFTSQTKEYMSTDVKDFGTEFEVTDKFVNKIIKSEVVQRVLDWAQAQQRQKELAALRKLEKKKKVHKSDKYFPATKEKKILIVGEGQSALGGLIPALGRENIGYFELKGKPLNCLNASVTKFKDNKELSELYAILNNEGYDYFVCGTDQDLDGFSIRMLLLGFVIQYVPDYETKFGYLDTPVIITKKSNKLVNWTYSLREQPKINKGEDMQYMKGLGTWDYKDLKEVIKKDGIESMIKLIDLSEKEKYLDWLMGDRVQVRKNQLDQHNFSIANL
jgi:DNA topoisomerase-2